MCCAPNVYMFVYTLIGAHIVPLMPKYAMKTAAMKRDNTIMLYNDDT